MDPGRQIKHFETSTNYSDCVSTKIKKPFHNKDLYDKKRNTKKRRQGKLKRTVLNHRRQKFIFFEGDRVME